VLTVFVLAGIKKKLWVPPKGLGFVLNNNVIYGGPGFDIIYGQTGPLDISSRTSEAKQSRPLSELEM
jgi:hypothetical protein